MSGLFLCDASGGGGWLAPQARKILVRMGGFRMGRHRAFQTPRVVAAPMQRCGSISGALAQAARHKRRLLATHCCSALRCAALRLGRVRRPPERGGRAPGLRPRQGVDGRPASREGKFWVLGFWGPGAFPGGPNWCRGSCTSLLRSPCVKTPCALTFFVWCRWWEPQWEVCAAGEKNPGAHGHGQCIGS